ncbi:hypothetical protein [Motilimonas sp. KMU-193]|uniref:hypothetical protein n=1 Tax=Motilimonas sp. KMU-193 TaxID=3388668 RepID=UPI00396B4402
MSDTIGMSATEWRHMYFVGITKLPVNQIDLTQAQMSGLLAMVNLNAVISSGTAVEPQYLINQKGTTPWLAMYALVNINDPTALNLVANGQSRIHVPSKFIQGAFGEHINWPAAMLKKYDLSLGEYRVFAIPFLVHQAVGTIGQLAQSMKAPDGSLELFGVYEWQDSHPEGLLKDVAELVSFIKEQRSDAMI